MVIGGSSKSHGSNSAAVPIVLAARATRALKQPEYKYEIVKFPFLGKRSAVALPGGDAHARLTAGGRRCERGSAQSESTFTLSSAHNAPVNAAVLWVLV